MPAEKVGPPIRLCALCQKPQEPKALSLLCETCAREETIFIIERRLEELTPDQRLEIFSKFCRGCGADELPCHCEKKST